MTKVTADATKAKTAKHAASPFGLPRHEIPKSDLLNMEMPEAFREIPEKGVAHAKDTYQKAKAAAEQTSPICLLCFKPMTLSQIKPLTFSYDMDDHLFVCVECGTKRTRPARRSPFR